MKFLGLPLERAASIAEGLLLVLGVAVALLAEGLVLALGVAVALLAVLVSRLNGRVKAAEALATNEAISVANTAAEVARAQLLELRRRLAPRTLTPDQAANLISALSRAEHKGRVKIVVPVGDREAMAYVTQIEMAFREAGWPVDAPRQGAISGTVTSSGLSISVNNPGNPPNHAAPMFDSFRSIGVEIVGGLDMRVMDGVVELLVDGKPIDRDEPPTPTPRG